MRLERKLLSNLLCFSVALCSFTATPVFAQGGTPTVSTVTLKVVPGPNGGENVITPRGMSVPLPGPGVNSNTVQVYIGSQGGYWYVDRNGENVDLTAAVQQFRAMTGQGGPSQVPQYAAAPAAPVQIVNQQTPSSSSGSGAAAGMATAAAAGLGAMAGSAMTGAYYNNGYYNHVPYGTPMYYPHGGSPYYVNASGNTVNVAHTYPTTSTTNNQATINGGNTNNIHADNFQKQQDWYQKQQQNNPQQFSKWQQSSQGENPFVAQQAGANAEGGRGRFGRREQAGEAGGGGEGGGRFGGRFNRGGDQSAAAGENNAGGGGLLQQRGEGGGGGRFGGGRLGGNGGGGGGRFGRRGN
ncbi:MAG: hypothetical protein K2X93_11085 [Candidatus Obscuribacterales bacterium]|nr:hypothetical protein [Candidatus Obscuribacterales bacterium]